MHATRLLCVVVLAVVFVMMSGPGGVRAQTQAGGLPAVNVRVTALEAIAATLQSAVTSLLTQVTALQTANTNLQNALNAESAARTAGDTALRTANTDFQNALNTEIAARRLADFSISNVVTALGSQVDNVARLGKAYEVEVRDTFLVNGDLGTLLVLDGLPAGRYFVIAKALVTNDDYDAEWTFYLLRNDEHFPNALDISSTTTDSGFIMNTSNVTLTAVATLPAPGGFKIQCFTLRPSSWIRWVKIIAIAVQ